MSWQAAALAMLALVVVGGFVWYERSRPSARIVAAVAALAALGVAGRVVLAPIPNVVATTDVALLAGYTLGGGPGFAVGALSGLVSNFWLGQGPWTPWQMAGWGLVGITGAGLARVSGRRLGRWGLAGVAAFAGLAYGALLDLSVMVQYGGEQSLDRYLALSVRGIPFNVAHALGNAALMLAAGPAMVRMLDRYRRRFEVSWRDAPPARPLAAVVLALCLALPLLAAPRTEAAKDEELSAGLAGARAWLMAAQNENGGFGTDAESDSSPGMTGWAMLGLEAAGLNPRDAAVGGTSPVQYLRDRAGKIDTTADLERTILALEGAGIDSRQFGGEDLVARLRDRQGKDGSFEKQVNLTAFGILAQRSAGVESGNVGKAAAWLRSVQSRNGGWGSVEEGESEADSTGAVLQALAVAPGDAAPIDEGARWLERSQRNDGGWSLTPGALANAQSTAWAIQGLEAAGRDPAEIRNDGTSGLDFLHRRQEDDGHYSYSRTSDQTPVWVTAQGLTGAARQPFPIARVAVIEDTVDDSTDDDATSSETDLGSAVDSSGYDTSGYDSGYDPYDDGSSGLGLGSGGGGGGGSGPRGGTDGPGAPQQGIPGDPAAAPDAGPLGEAEAPLEAPTEELTATMLLASTEPGSSLPATGYMLAGLGVLAVALGGGFFWYRRRLP